MEIFGPTVQGEGLLVGCVSLSQACERRGSIAREWFRELNMLVLSPKPPSAGESIPIAAIHACLAFAPSETVLKIVVFNREDYLRANDG
jgi:7-carboxy-7-deazaguanine synthase